MAINFPDSPATNDTFTVGNQTFIFDGTKWIVDSFVGYTGSTGFTGSAGTTGFTGSVGSTPDITYTSSSGITITSGTGTKGITGIGTDTGFGGTANNFVIGSYVKISVSVTGTTYIIGTITAINAGSIVIDVDYTTLTSSVTTTWNVTYAGVQGPIGYTGSQGVIGYTGSQGIVGNYVAQGATSGNGISGSVNSVGGTFTVTSNATTNNTANTLVFRDASGNFAANQITLAGDILPDTDNTGNVGTAALTWGSGQFTNLTVDGTLSVRTAIDLADNDDLRFGTGDDYIIDFDGTNLVIHRNVGGNVLITDTDNSTRFTFAPATGAFTTTGNISAGGRFEESYTAVGTGTTINCSLGNVFAATPSGNVTYTFSNPPTSGTAYGFTLTVTPSATISITWPTSVDWAGGTAPTAPASGETDVFAFFTRDGGTTWYGFQSGDAMA